MSSSASSLALPSLTSNIRSLCNSKPTSVSLQFISSVSLRFHSKPISISASFLHSDGVCQGLSSRFVRRVTFSSEFDQEEEVSSDGDDRSFSRDLQLFVGNIPFSVDSAQLAELFETAGTVEKSEVIYDQMTGRSRGFGFVTMSTVEEVKAAAQQFNGYELDGRSIRVNYGPPPSRREDSSFRSPRGGASSESGNRVYVGNLSWGVDNLALENLFGEQGKVLEAKVIYDRDTGRSKGFGFVTYSSSKEVNNAIESLDGADLDGRPIRVSVAAERPRRQF
ncbi:RNA-binding protein CP29B, chloroplastic-like [Quillaja saponaria]|uniref:RNA-binding protein CP29B, chloroplastic-like n=1 Tax=Quillaja saponaria TaxID=32244 RepID=A0AAD7Q026_QUISA|nr:RNA-binding protein CP29B, chloroplastic-like [Quillaja saponaria]